MFHAFRIAANAFRESLREPVYFLMLLAALLLISHYPWMTLFVFFEQLKLVVDGAMATTMLFGLAIGVLCAVNTVSREMRNGTVLLLLSKPLSRWAFVTGKILGVSAAALFFGAICSCASFVSVFVAVDQFRLNTGLYGLMLLVLALGTAFGLLLNYLKGSSFAEYATYAVAAAVLVLMLCTLKLQDPPELSLVNLTKVLLLLNLGIVVMTAFSVGFAARFDSVTAIICSTALFFLGLVSSYLFTRPTGSALLDAICAALYALIPNWQFFWLADAIASGKKVSLTYLCFAMLYALGCFLLASLWTAALFQNREAASDNRN